LVVFDFDKTLTKKDTLFGFYREVDGKNPFFLFKHLILLSAAVLFKFRFINNDRLKKTGVRLFLMGKSRKKIMAAAQSYSKKIELNKIYREHYSNLAKEEKVILSASLEEYLKFLFPGEQVYASTLNYSNDRVKGLTRNLYGDRKKRLLNSFGIDKIICLYTDSYMDEPLMRISEKVFLVKEDRKIRIK